MVTWGRPERKSSGKINYQLLSLTIIEQLQGFYQKQYLKLRLWARVNPFLNIATMDISYSTKCISDAMNISARVMLKKLHCCNSLGDNKKGRVGTKFVNTC